MIRALAQLTGAPTVPDSPVLLRAVWLVDHVISVICLVHHSSAKLTRGVLPAPSRFHASCIPTSSMIIIWIGSC